MTRIKNTNRKKGHVKHSLCFNNHVDFDTEIKQIENPYDTSTFSGWIRVSSTRLLSMFLNRKNARRLMT